MCIAVQVINILAGTKIENSYCDTKSYIKNNVLLAIVYNAQ